MPTEPEVTIIWDRKDARNELSEYREILAFLQGYKAARFVAESMGVKPWTDFPTEPDFTFLKSLVEDLTAKTAE